MARTKTINLGNVTRRINRDATQGDFSSSTSYIRAKALYRQQPKARKGVPVFPVLLWVWLLTLAGIFSVWISCQVREEQYRIGSLKEEIARLEIENHQVRGEVARLESPARLETIAKEQIGLVYPEPRQVLSLSPSVPTGEKQISLAQPSGSSSGN
jgi:cell division protein FtsL